MKTYTCDSGHLIVDTHNAEISIRTNQTTKKLSYPMNLDIIRKKYDISSNVEKTKYLNYPKMNMRMKIKASKPDLDKNSSSEGSHAFFTQLAVGNRRSKLNWSPCWTFPSVTKRGA